MSKMLPIGIILLLCSCLPSFIVDKGVVVGKHFIKPSFLEKHNIDNNEITIYNEAKWIVEIKCNGVIFSINNREVYDKYNIKDKVRLLYDAKTKEVFEVLPEEDSTK